MFDARKAKLLPSGDHIVINECPGLRLVATGQHRAWTYRYKSPVNGKMRQIKIGHWPAMPVGVAISEWQKLKSERDAGGDPAVAKKATIAAKKETVYTVRNVVDDYYHGHLLVNRQRSGADAVYARLVKAIEPLADKAAQLITRRIAFDLISSLSDTPVAAKSVRNELGAAWAHALDSGKLPDDTPNWWRDILAGKLRSKGAMRDGEHKGTAKRTLSEAELKTLLTVDLSRFSQQVQDFLIIHLWTCTRGGEICHMHRNQITNEPDGWWWTVPKALTKGRNRKDATDLRVPLIGRALEIVQRLGDGWLFPSVSRKGVIGPQTQAYMGTKVHYLQPYSKVKPYHVRERLVVTHWSPHDLRRTGRTMLSQMDCPTDVAEAILGHVQPGVQGVYNLSKYDKQRRHWLALLSDRLESLVSTAVRNR